VRGQEKDGKSQTFQSVFLHLLTFHFSLFTGEETPLACLPSLLRRSSFGYEGRELGPGTADPSARLRACFFNILADRSE
jgi:hypothetical protein